MEKEDILIDSSGDTSDQFQSTPATSTVETRIPTYTEWFRKNWVCEDYGELCLGS